jgi:autophagy-related protein 2
VDLDRLLTLITPSKDKYDDDDDIMLDTLLRQRRQGSVLRVTVAGMKTVISSPAGLAPLASLGSELGRLSTVTKYLPEDDRPGILILTLVREFETQVHVGGDVGDINAHLTNVEVAWISMPSLTATQIGSLVVTRNHKEELVGEALLSSKEKTPIAPRPPVLMARFIPDEMDPTFKIKLHHLRVEYTIPSVMAFLGLGQDTTGGELAGEMANSIANLAEHSDRIAGASTFSPSRSEASGASSKPTKLAVVFQDCVLGLNPRNSPAKGLVVLTNSKFSGTLHGDESSEATLDIRKASIMIIDNEANAGSADNLRQRTSAVTQSDQVQEYIAQGYVPVSSISTATAVVKMMRLAEDGAKSLDVELKNRLLILETCADSTQTLISILNGLQPPTPPSVTVKYRTEVTPIQDMLASFSGNAFNADPVSPSGEKIDPALDLGGIPEEEELANDELEYVSDFYPKQQDSSIGDVNIESTSMGGNNELFDSFHSQYHVSSSLTELDFREDHFAKQSAVGGTAHRWDSTENTYGLSNDNKLQKSPLRVRVRDVHVIWNLFDGYDWQRTRDTISKAVEDVEIKATERRARTSRMSPAAEDEEESVIGDFLFNSIYIGIPANKDPRELHREINRDINDLTSETGSYATSTTVTGATARQGRSVSGREKKRLRLHRSKHHKMTFELSGICADLVVFPPGSEETQSSLDVRVKDLEIYDHVPTSTWKKFATYLHEAGERESGTSMVHLEILTVKPIPELAASEIVLKVSDLQNLVFWVFN